MFNYFVIICVLTSKKNIIWVLYQTVHLFVKVVAVIVNNKRIIQAVEWAGKKINSPQQRFILGLTAIAIQPVIDYTNKQVDEETRQVSAARTMAKIIAGTSVGVIVRWACIKAVNAFSGYELKTEGFRVLQILKKSKKDIFTPSLARIADDVTVENFKQMYRNHVKNLGSILATLVMIGTNFLLDVPLTVYLTNNFTKLVKSFKKNAKGDDNNV